MHTFQLMSELKKMHAELSEHRYYLEKNVAGRTEHLSRRIDLLESCNKTLCSKLTMLKKGPAVGHEHVDSTLYLLNSAQVA